LAKNIIMRLTEEEFLAIAKLQYAEMNKQLKPDEVDFYEYESRLDVIMNDFGRRVLEGSLSDTTVSSDKKKRFKRGSVKSA